MKDKPVQNPAGITTALSSPPRTLTVAAVCLLLATAATGAAEPLLKGHPDSSSWPRLFREDLADAAYPKGIWFMQDGALTASEDQMIWTTNVYENFIVDLEFKCLEGANSGVVVYDTDMPNWIPNSVEIQILDDNAEKWATVADNWKCGGIFGHVAPRKGLVKKAGEWSRMTVGCRGPRIEVWLNGERASEIDMKQFTSNKQNPDGSEIPSWLSRPLAELATRGHIGLQGKHGGAAIFFRNVKIKTTRGS